MLARLERQRGQTLPFWSFSILMLLTMLFFLSNYVNILGWHVRAQNAADSAATASLSVQANVYNEISTILYATAVDENRVRYLNQAILNTIYGAGGCDSTPGGSCDQNYRTLVTEYDQAVSAYQGNLQVLQEGNNFTEGGQQADEKKAIRAIGSDCSNFDCAFAFNVNTQTYAGQCQGKKCSGSPTEADVVTCHNVPYFAASLLHMTGQFQAIGRAAGVVAPIATESFDPGTAVNPSTNQVYQPVEAQWANAYPSAAYTVDYSGMKVNVNWYGVGHLRPWAGALQPSSMPCN
ncbi:MAG TPA: pilus assembly protein TadG-related protein [Candidatus Baltobacteraceae bacterium]